MLETLALGSYMAVMFVTPGPNNIMLTASGVNFGFRRTLPHMFGIACGMALLLLTCGLLFAEISQYLGQARPLLAVAGCSYLLYLAWKLAGASAPQAREVPRPMSFHAAALFQWVNPKAWVMVLNTCVLFLPQGGQLGSTGSLALLAVVVNLPCIAVWAWAGDRLRHWLQQAWALRLFNGVMALLLAGTAGWMLWGELGQRLA